MFDEIKRRHMKFIETPMERQMRVLGEWDNLWKGNRSALQFEAVFEEAVTELELAGLAKIERELLLGYLQKIGPQLAAEVQKDVRVWRDVDGTESSRRVATWEEAHRVHVEYEAIKASGRALIPTYSTETKGGSKGFGKKGFDQAGAKSNPACWEMIEKGSCWRGAECRFSHDHQEVAAARKGKGKGQAHSAPQKVQQAAPLKGKGKSKSKRELSRDRNGKGKSKGSKGGGKGKHQHVAKVQFPDRLCPNLKRGQACRFPNDCKFSHEKHRFDQEGWLKSGNGS